MQEPGLPRGSFFGNVNIVLLTYAVDGMLAVGSGVLIARALGPGGRGVFGLFVLSTALGQTILGLGFGNAAIYYLGKGRMPVRDVVSAAHVVVLGALAVSAIAVAAMAPLTGADVLGEGVPAWLLIPAVPVLLYASLLRFVLQAERRFVDMGVTTILQPAVMLVVVSVLFAADAATPSRVVGVWIASNAAAAGLALARIGLSQVDLAQITRPRWHRLRTLTRFGVQGEAGNMLQLLNYRLDQYIVRGFVGLAGVGVYAVGVSITEAVWLLANAVAIVLLPHLTSADPEEVRWMAPVATRNTLMVAAGGAALLAVSAPVAIPIVFGHAYDESVQALWLLLPGTVALTGSKVLTSYIFSQGRPLVNTMITLVSLVVTVIALFALVPAFGVKGAAAASSLAYCAHFAAALHAYRRIARQPVLEAVIPRPSDARLYVDAVRGLFARMSGRGLQAGAPRSGG
ncbi:MAG: polysaccharide biosynthesis C-terminal domain-containing protein [Chloroflexota bacterium]|nr:polysaccharide biosynthesis C-terminal domain-containing protein [Chloroflexota bacterium]